MLAMLIIGGLASIKGSVISVVALSIITESMRFMFTDIQPELIGAMRQMLFMAILIVILIYKPRGMFGKVDV